MSKKKFDIYRYPIGVFVLWCVLIVLLCIAYVNSFADASDGEMRVLFLVLLIISCLIFIPAMIGSFLCMNVISCRVWYDSEKNELYRKGFLVGYKYKLKIEDVKDVFIYVTAPPGVTEYIIISAHNDRNIKKIVNKKPIIRVLNTERNREILLDFWARPLDVVVQKYKGLLL